MADLLDDAVSSSADSSGELTQDAMVYMHDATPWMKFLAIVGFIGSGLILLGSFGILAMSRMLGGAAMIVFVLYLALAGIGSYISYRLLLAANSFSEFYFNKDSYSLEKAFLNQKKYWVAVGVFTIIVIAFYIITILFLGSRMSLMGRRSYY